MATLIPTMVGAITKGELWLGNLEDAKGAYDERLCVLEGLINYRGLTWHVPVLRPFEEDPKMRASRRQLDLAADLISKRLHAGIKLLVHCGAGVERSPLTCAWYLVNYEGHASLNLAYDYLRSHRNIVQDRQTWLEAA